ARDLPRARRADPVGYPLGLEVLRAGGTHHRLSRGRGEREPARDHVHVYPRSLLARRGGGADGVHPRGPARRGRHEPRRAAHDGADLSHLLRRSRVARALPPQSGLISTMNPLEKIYAESPEPAAYARGYLRRLMAVLEALDPDAIARAAEAMWRA